MRQANLGAVRPFATAAVLVLLAAPTFGQVVEKGRTFADLTASHPCTNGLTERIARVIDCDAADDVGDGGGAFQCWVRCDGSAPWETVAIGAGGGGLPGADEVTEAMLKSVNGPTDEYMLTYESTTGDFEWQAPATGTIGGSTGATDDALLCADGVGGSTLGVCTIANIDNLRADGNTISTTNSNGSLVLAPNGTGTVTVPAGSESIPSVKFSTDLDTGIYSVGLDGSIGFVTNGSTNAFFRAEGFRTNNATYINGFSVLVEANTAGSGAPNVLASNELMTVLTNEGATAENYHTLPTAVAGYTFTFVVQDADGMRITAAAGDTIRPIAGTAASATAGFIRCATQGAFITLVAINSTEWVAIGSAGTWTIDV